MTGRERVLQTLERRPTDRIAFDLGGTDCSGIHVVAHQRLRARLGLPVGTVRCGCLTQLISEIEADLQQAFAVDAEALFFGAAATKIWHAPFGVDLVVPKLFAVEDLPDGSSVVKNPRGQIYAQRAGGAMYFDPVGAPLAGISAVSELDVFDALFERWDYPSVFDEPLPALAERARRQYMATDRAVVALWCLHYLQAGQLLRGYEQFLVDLMVDKRLARAILDKLHQVYLRRVETFFDAFGDFFDIVFLTDDLGTQQSSLIAPAVYREMLFPCVSELVGRIKARGKKVVMHSCGAVAEFIPSMIEMGVDALNPVQVSAAGMDPRWLVREFGKDIAFWGGGCDTQHALNAAGTDRVRAEVRRRFREFGDQAAWIFTQVHNIQYDVPAENIVALRDAFRQNSRG